MRGRQSFYGYWAAARPRFAAPDNQLKKAKVGATTPPLFASIKNLPYPPGIDEQKLVVQEKVRNGLGGSRTPDTVVRSHVL